MKEYKNRMAPRRAIQTTPSLLGSKQRSNLSTIHRDDLCRPRKEFLTSTYQNHSSSKTARAAEIFDFFLNFLEEPNPNSTNSLSGAAAAAAGVGAGVVSSITRSEFSRVECLSLTDLNKSVDTSSESLDSSLAESLSNSKSD